MRRQTAAHPLLHKPRGSYRHSRNSFRVSQQASSIAKALKISMTAMQSTNATQPVNSIISVASFTCKKNHLTLDKRTSFASITSNTQIPSITISTTTRNRAPPRSHQAVKLNVDVHAHRGHQAVKLNVDVNAHRADPLVLFLPSDQSLSIAVQSYGL